MNISNTPRDLELIDLGLIDYNDALNFQRARHRQLIDGSCESALILCQHPPVITRGRSARDDTLISTAAQLSSAHIELHDVERGGDITFHGPGQFVAYPMLRLSEFKTDVGWYMRTLEEVIIQSLIDSGISAHRIPGKTGVWTSPTHKIASLGVKISRWCTMHGIAVNILRSSEAGFQHIIPCGLNGVSATSLERELGQEASLDQYRQVFNRQFECIFSVLLRPAKG